MVPNQANIVAAASIKTRNPLDPKKDAGVSGCGSVLTSQSRGGCSSRVTNTRESGAASSEPAADDSLAGGCPAPSLPTPGCGAPTSLPSSPKARSAAPLTLTRGDGRDVGGASSSDVRSPSPCGPHGVGASAPPGTRNHTSLGRAVGGLAAVGAHRSRCAPQGGSRGGKPCCGVAWHPSSASRAAASRSRGESDAAPARGWGRTFCEGRR